ncbi:MAG: hypothetical protein AB2L14_11255 [Candidatus Xenobiia bacterium LiM19]
MKTGERMSTDLPLDLRTEFWNLIGSGSYRIITLENDKEAVDMILAGNVQKFKKVRDYPIYKSTQDGNTVYRIQENKEGKRKDDSILIKMDKETRDWYPIDSCEKAIECEDMKINYGLWKKGILSSILGKEGIQQKDVTSFRNESDTETYVGTKPYNPDIWKRDDHCASSKMDGLKKGKLYCYSYLATANVRKINDEWTLEEWYLLNDYTEKKQGILL